MKSVLNITGRVELSREEVTIAIFEWLKRNHPYKPTKVVYLPSTEKFVGCVIEVTQEEAEQSFDIPKFGKEPKKERENDGGFTRRNIGVFDTIRSILNDAFKGKEKDQAHAIVKFEDILKEVIFQHPGMDKQKMGVYLHDKRQLPNTDFSGRMGVITIKGIVNHY